MENKNAQKGIFYWYYNPKLGQVIQTPIAPEDNIYLIRGNENDFELAYPGWLKRLDAQKQETK